MNETGKVTAHDGLHLRQYPNDKSKILYTLAHDAVVKIERKDGNWYSVRTAWGERGYLYSKFVAVIPAGPEPAPSPPLLPARPIKYTPLFIVAGIVAAVMWLYSCGVPQ
jgi:hypothetical protein